MAVSNRPDALQGVDGIPGCGALTFALNGALKSLGVPGHHAVGEQCQSTGRGDQLLGAPTALRGKRLRADLTLQGVDRFSAFEHTVQGPAKVRQCEVIAQVHRAQKSSQRVACPMYPITARSTAEAFQHVGRRAPSLIDRGGYQQQVIPPLPDRLEGHVMLNNTDDGGGHFESPRQMQMSIAQTIESRAKIQVQQFGNRHPKIRVAMRVDR